MFNGINLSRRKIKAIEEVINIGNLEVIFLYYKKKDKKSIKKGIATFKPFLSNIYPNTLRLQEKRVKNYVQE